MSAVTDLEKSLIKLSDISYDSVDKLMRKIAKDNDISATELHHKFKAKHKIIPDDWAKKQMQEGWSDKYKKSINCDDPKGFSQKAHCQGKEKKMNEDLRKWFGTGGEGGVGGGGWDRYNTKGERIGKCAREPGEPKPKCLSKEKAAKMTKSEIASAVKRKRKKDPVADRSGKGGKPKMVSNKIGEGYDGKDHEVSMAQSQLDNTIKDAKKLKKSLGKKEKNLPAWMQAKITDTEHNMDAAASYSEEKGPCWTGYKQVGMKKKNGKQVPNCVPESASPLVKKVLDRHFATEELQQFEEENKPTNPKLWSRAKALAKQKFDVYPSAYANGWASKWYKSKGGGWKSVKEEVEVSEAVTLRSRTGNVYIVSFLFRGKLMMIKLFFPVAKRPSREQVQTAIEGAYPGAKVQRYDVTMVQPGDSYLTPNITAFEEVDHNQELDEDWQKVNKQDKTDGMSPAAVKAYRRENPGSKLKTAVTGDPKPGSKDAKRRKSFCSRSKGQQDMHNIDCSKTPDKAICKARRRWKC